MRAVTTFAQKHWDVYVKDFFESAVEYWPTTIYAYYEHEPPDFHHEKVVFLDLFKETECQKFLDCIEPLGACHGFVGPNKRYYQWDLVKFCRKIFAQTHQAMITGFRPDPELFWLDADIVFKKQVPEHLLNQFLEDTYMCYLGRPDWHSCASFIGWNTAHVDNKRFMNTYLHTLLRGDVFHLQEWHDSFILDTVRKRTDVPARNISANVTDEGPCNVFDLSPMGEYAHHKKGNLKHQLK